ncbi:cupin domain-containing protein [Pedobacter aquatilis]|uniref:(R)-mandelonitrile lyase n=1 Tax=Pedobacter aquatilis TaxID=351343 RepID=UPI00293050E4|nr:cupin domain-containing protein [Pedobacter aquatilis]
MDFLLRKHIILSMLAILPFCYNLKAQSLVSRQESNFTGKVSVKMLTSAENPLDCTMGNVSFQPGARTNWHKHPGGQILMITEGTAFYQERGKPKRLIRKGEVVTCLPNVEHWHGASKDSAMTHLAVGPNTDKGKVVWLEKVGDDVYQK